MGFGTIIANVVMFITVLLLATAVIVVFKGTVEDSTTSMQAQSDRMSNQIKTDLHITSAVYNESETNITVYAQNIGETVLNLDNVDVYVDGLFIDRNTSVRQMHIQPSTHVRNAGFWDPSEVLEIYINRSLSTSSTHMVALTTQYGTKEETRISMP